MKKERILFFCVNSDINKNIEMGAKENNITKYIKLDNEIFPKTDNNRYSGIE